MIRARPTSNAYARSEDNSLDNNNKISLTDPVPRDDGSYPPLTDISDIFQQVENYILSGDVRPGVKRTEKALLSFSMTRCTPSPTSQVYFLVNLETSIFCFSIFFILTLLVSLTISVLCIQHSSFFNAELDRILGPVLHPDEELADWGYLGLQYEYSDGAFESGYASLAELASAAFARPAVST
ncbi:hypothetical protein GUITHDRAFT_109967 [Guillardia theta CCMP2712]|uniref:Uncharacterized protein n=1 Tax=Guillardia theta (strain CCMP2712) TaxID=905079 RepID=L1J764_GUITC|nr:hypothetical protein GUITHDRAFT_109967 [Guillardia theta CCMP2712]EKX44182.1 hypothetical protein GUITHDRAFT_109967 [Guillardia theta CCMP2712]|eukprot:XP_005831162.1 hypothetical protein GUITHDRAFT_109967 [Guillardia theta CCMP2712]